MGESMIKLGTLFSGGLAAPEFALKYENIPHEVVFACEIDKYARKQYLQFHGEPRDEFYHDVTKLDGTKYRNKIDLLVWGSPCQDLSLAGKRKGFNGDKSSLFREGARIQSEIMPKNFIFENVVGLLSSNNGNDYKEVLRTFREQGYHIVTLRMNTKDYGIPQNRDRIFIVGFLDENEYLDFREPQPKKLKISLKDLLDKEVDEKYYLSDKFIAGMKKHRERHKERGNGFKFEPKEADNIKNINCLSCGYGTRATDTYIIDTKGHNLIWGRVYAPKGIAVNLNANGGGAGAKTGLYQIKNRIRKLTPKECFRLQGVKDKDIVLVNSDTQSYKIAGNAISVNVMQEIVRELYKKDRSIKTNLFDF